MLYFDLITKVYFDLHFFSAELVNQFKICKPSYIITDFKQMEKIKKVASQIESVKVGGYLLNNFLSWSINNLKILQRVFTLKEEHVDSDDTILNMIEKDDGSGIVVNFVREYLFENEYWYFIRCR